MKKFNFTLLASLGIFLSLTSCDKEPDFDKLDDDYIVRTDRDPQFDFSSKSSYYLGDTVYVVDGSNNSKIVKWEYHSSKNAEAIIDAVKAKMDVAGYTAVTDTAKAEMTFFVTYFNDVQAFASYDYWWDYYDAWGGWYWGYYPSYPPYYPPVYVYQLGSIEIDIINQKVTPTITSDGHKTKPVVWRAYATGLNSGRNSYDRTLVVNSINTAFDQSPYLSRKK